MYGEMFTYYQKHAFTQIRAFIGSEGRGSLVRSRQPWER
jgi:hypothetical protein